MTPNESHNETSAAPKPTPKPGPRPGPKPGSHMGATAGRPVVTPVAPAPSDPSKFGRVDEDCTAWVKTAHGERQVGVYQAGSAAEGLAHFGGRYDDLSTEIGVLEARLISHPEEAQRIRSDATSLLESVPNAPVIGDLEALETRLKTVIDDSFIAEKKAEQDKEHRREAAIAAKEKLAAEAEDLGARATDWKATGDRFRAMMNEWKAIRGVPHTQDEQLWNRFSSGREKFNQRRSDHFANMDNNREVAKRKKENLVERAEAMSDSTDWGKTARAYKDLMQEWKAAGRAHREDDDALWERFRAAQDKFFDARHADSKKRDVEFADNAMAKQKLLDEYESRINPKSEGLERSKNALRELQEKWEQIGFVPRNQIREFEDKISNLESRVAQAEEAEWRKTDPEAQARVAQFQNKADQLNKEADQAAKNGNSSQEAKLRAQAEQWSQWAHTAAATLED